MNSSNFDDIDEVVKNSNFTIFCDIKDCGSGAKSSDFTADKLRDLFDRSENWLINIMKFYHYELKQKYYLVVKNNDSTNYYNYLFDSKNIDNADYHLTFKDNAILNHDRYNVFYDELQEYYNTYRTDLLRFKCPLSRHNNGIYITVYIKKSNFKLDFYYKNFCDTNVDFAIKCQFMVGVYMGIDFPVLHLKPKYSKIYNKIDGISIEEIMNFIKETNFTDEEKEKCYLKFIYSMAAGYRFKENYMKLSDFSDKIFIKELCTKYNLVFSENCFVETMKKLAKMIEVEK